jgi:hypothetical protein
MKIPDTNKLMSIAMIIGIVIALFIVYKILAATGLVKTAAAKKEAANETQAVNDLRTDEYWQPEYHLKVKYNALDEELAKSYASDIRHAVRGLGTDEEAIYTTFGYLRNKAQISQIADEYKKGYGLFTGGTDNLQKDLLNDLNDSEVAQLMTIINRLPNT